MTLLPPCHFSGLNDLEMIMSFGNTPIADRLLEKPDLPDDNFSAPLNLAFSQGSKLVQLVETVPANILYDNHYPYFSSVSPLLLRHFKKSADNIIARKKLSRNSMVIEAASNDGYMLQNFISMGIPVLGIEPAGLQASTAIKKGIPTLNAFFTSELASELVTANTRADVFIGNNILAHAENLNDFIEGLSIILKPDGLAVMEVPYVVEMVKNCEFDTIYHQHIYYFSLMSLIDVFEKYDLYINNVELIDIHGGSLRLFIEKRKNPGEEIFRLLEDEEKLGVSSLSFYKSLNTRAADLKLDLLKLIYSLKNNGKKISAYGAAAKATTFLSYMNLGSSVIDYIVDRNCFKHGKYMPGNHLEIFPVDKLFKDMPDYTLILSWNFADEIIKQMKPYIEAGGKFIIPIPTLEIIQDYDFK